MQLTPTAGRNDPCPCGSGRKYKACCLAKQESDAPPRSPTRWIVPGVVAILVIAAVSKAAFDSSKRNAAKTTQGADSTPTGLAVPGSGLGGGTPQPPGGAPPGKVWSSEHGHWHDAPQGQPSVTIPAGGNNSGGGSTPPPPGPAPEGKVWSPEHGHWHDAPTVVGQTSPAPAADHPPSATTPAAQPPGPAPEGKVWSPEHGHWHDAPAVQDASAPTDPLPSALPPTPQGTNPTQAVEPK